MQFLDLNNVVKAAVVNRKSVSEAVESMEPDAIVDAAIDVAITATTFGLIDSLFD